MARATSMNVFIFVVNYGTDEYLTHFLQSVHVARAEAPGTNVEIHVLENLRVDEEGLEGVRAATRRHDLDVSVHTLGYNSGYFGGLSVAQELVTETTDAVIYCNPDIVLEPGFFHELQRTRNAGAGVLAPSIWTGRSESDLNPMYVSRPSRAKLKRLRLIYSNTLSFVGHDLLHRTRERLRRATTQPRPDGPTNVYAAHGCLLIFRDITFFRALPRWECFLFLEELFIAEEARLRGVHVAYAPQLRARHFRHVSTRSLGANERRRYMYESVSHILERYYPD